MVDSKLKFGTSVCVAALIAAWTTAADAQLVSTIPGVQTSISADPNGVDLVTGVFTLRHVDLTFGPNASTNLTIETQVGSGDGDNYSGYVYEMTESGINYLYAVRGSSTEKFRVYNGTYTSVSGNGATLSHAAGADTYLLTQADGVRVEYYHHHYSSAGLFRGSAFIDYINYIQHPDGERLTVNTSVVWSNWCESTGDDEFATTSPASASGARSSTQTQDAGATGVGTDPNMMPPNRQCYTYPWRGGNGRS